MSSSQEINIVAPARVSNKLTIDSQQEERREQQQRQRLQEIQKRREEKRKRRQEAEREELQRKKQQEQKQKKYDQPALMFQEDSDDGVEFRRVVKKIRRLYPDQINHYETKKKNFIVADDEDEDSEQSDSGSYDEDSGEQQSNHKHTKKEKKQAKVERKQKRVVEKRVVEKKKVEVVVKKQKVKVEHKSDRKQNLVKQVSVRWWYALPEWPPVDFNYEAKLKELGYRVLDAEKFKLEPEIVNGLQKVTAVDGYLGVYKSKTVTFFLFQKLIDIRPKQSAPTLNNFRNKSIEQLTNILIKALTVQIQQLKNVKHQQRLEPELLVELQRKLIKLK